MSMDTIEWTKINKVLPLVYDDTLSYYEVLCKLISTCNDVIEMINTLEQELGSYSPVTVEYVSDTESLSIAVE